MFTGVWLRICFHFGRQQQTVTITTPGVTDIQFLSTLQHDYQHSPSKQAPPPHYQAPQQHAGSSNLHAPVQPPAPKQKSAHNIPRILRYSKCTGRKKALCVGINYKGTGKELNGCVNDAKNVRKFLLKNWNFKPEDIVVLTDDTQDPRRLPTKANMLSAMKWLVRDAKAHDSLFFHYSGHGGQIRDTDGDEVDGYDEVIFPLDYERKGVGIITDDTMNELLVRPIPDGCRLTSCHSGSALGTANGKLKNSDVTDKFRKLKSSAGDVISFSACEDSQTSADVVKNGMAVGAMSYTFIKCLDANPKLSYQQLLKNVRALLRKHYTQKPQLSSSHKIDTNRSFIL
ncbi:hypothetical protein BDM02DRAFT_3156037 [Thelephora ganbajun]|uniref:Uncharacterized protein n=1 Tax=Thelephora ganbajun TaxID=370292 RepID=A0ACB6ZDC3_THEGA|nr:hypothetical protein BDM02DRAFT_3156037 [Thelephora ganbajun]